MNALRMIEEEREAPATLDRTTSGQGDSPIQIGALKELTLALLKEVESLVDSKTAESRQHICLHKEVRRFETDLIRCALVRTGGHQRRAARLLGIKVTTLNAKIKRYGIEPAPPATHKPLAYFD